VNHTEIAPGISTAGQIRVEDLAALKDCGIATILCNRPDDEEPGQPGSEAIRMEAERLGLAFASIPIPLGPLDERIVIRTAQALEHLPRPILAYCRSGARSTMAIDAARRLRQSGGGEGCDVLIIGGGAAGIATAASLLRRRPALSVTIVDPAGDHFYQPGWTMVGAGVFPPEATRRSMASLIPAGAVWMRKSALAFVPESRKVIVSDGSTLSYRVLVVACGIKLDWDAIPGLAESLGSNGVTSNYRYDLAPYTHRLVSGLTGGRALFTQPPMPIKCAGAPQKAMYLSCDQWRRAGRLPAIEVGFHSAAPALFGVAAYVPPLMAYVERYGIDLTLQSRLIAVDGPGRLATFERTLADGTTQQEETGFDMLHVVPPQAAPDIIRASPLAAANGFVDVDEATLRHTRFQDIFALGDVCSASNAKTAAAARKQAPIVAENVLATLDGRALPCVYDGYGSCPLTVERGRIVLAEFGYGGTLLPTFPTWLLDGMKPTRRAWRLKETLLPFLYWNAMLKGREWLARPARKAD